jgi:transcriptional regulator with XRE-family HTH domain
MKLSKARKDAGFSQTKLGRRSGVDQRTISKIENGKIVDSSHRVVVKICRALGVDPQDIDEFKVNGGRS